MQGSIKIDVDFYGRPTLEILCDFSSKDVRDKLIQNFVCQADQFGIELDKNQSGTDGRVLYRISPKDFCKPGGDTQTPDPVQP